MYKRYLFMPGILTENSFYERQCSGEQSLKGEERAKFGKLQKQLSPCPRSEGFSGYWKVPTPGGGCYQW